MAVHRCNSTTAAEQSSPETNISAGAYERARLVGAQGTLAERCCLGAPRLRRRRPTDAMARKLSERPTGGQVHRPRQRPAALRRSPDPESRNAGARVDHRERPVQPAELSTEGLIERRRLQCPLPGCRSVDVEDNEDLDVAR